MEHLLSEPIFNAWWKFLLEATLARQHQKVNFEHIQGSSPNPILDSLLPSLLTLRAVTILDEAMQVYIEHHGPKPPKSYKPSFAGRIDYLSDQKRITNSADLHHLRERRNALAHEANAQTTWGDFDRDIDIVESALRELGCVGVRPLFDFYAQRVSKPSTKLGVAIAFDLRYGLKENGEKVFEVSWSREHFLPSFMHPATESSRTHPNFDTPDG